MNLLVCFDTHWQTTLVWVFNFKQVLKARGSGSVRDHCEPPYVNIRPVRQMSLLICQSWMPRLPNKMTVNHDETLTETLTHICNITKKPHTLQACIKTEVRCPVRQHARVSDFQDSIQCCRLLLSSCQSYVLSGIFSHSLCVDVFQLFCISSVQITSSLPFWSNRYCYCLLNEELIWVMDTVCGFFFVISKATWQLI